MLIESFIGEAIDKVEDEARARGVGRHGHAPAGARCRPR